MSNNFQGSFDNIALQFEGGSSWIGTYQMASQKQQQKDLHFKYLDTSCAICMSDYLPTDQIIVLPCSHGLHERCFSPLTSQICPFDQTPVEGVKKILLSGYSLTLPGETRKLGIFLQTHQEKINDLIKSTLQDNSKKLQDNPEECHLFASFNVSFIQDLLNIYAYNGDSLDTYISERLQDFLTRLERFNHYMKDYKAEHNFEINIYLINKFFKDNPDWPKQLEALINHGFYSTHITINAQGIRNVLSYMNVLVNTALNSPEFTKMVQESDRIFFTNHSEAIQNLPNEKERLSYLSAMEPDDLQRLKCLTQGGGPASLEINKNIEKIEAQRKRTLLIKKAVAVTALLVTNAAILVLWYS